MNVMSHAILATVMCGASVGIYADGLPTVIDKCPKGFAPAAVDITLQVSTSLDCPLLEDEELRKLVDKFGVGSVFAYPAVVGSCFSGSNLEGTITMLKTDQTIYVEGYSESAQRLFAEAEAVGNPLFISGTSDNTTGSPFASGAAMTVVSLKGISTSFELDLVLADRFTIDYSDWLPPFVDTEDFLVVGAKGDLTVSGRLNGSAEISSFPGSPFYKEPLSVSGIICVK
jgi:hypothetical protein